MMRLIFRTTLLFLLFITVTAIQANSKKSFDWSKVINAIIEVESKGDSKAINKVGNCVGIMQITPILVSDCNRILKERNIKKRYTLKDRYNVSKSREMFLLIQDYYNPSNNVEKAIRSWNGGRNYSKKSTNDYYRKVMAAMK